MEEGKKKAILALTQVFVVIYIRHRSILAGAAGERETVQAVLFFPPERAGVVEAKRVVAAGRSGLGPAAVAPSLSA
jgi:hypothetical protein